MKDNTIVILALAAAAFWWFSKAKPVTAGTTAKVPPVAPAPSFPYAPKTPTGTVKDVTGQGMVLMWDPSGKQGNAWIFPQDVAAYISGGWKVV